MPKDERLENMSLDVVTEYILNYGDYDAVKELLALLGVDKVAEIFYRNTASGRRVNYLDLTKHYFTLYFDRHASRDIKRRAEKAAALTKTIQ